MIVKVCGITDERQLDKLIQVGVDMVGFNFYPASKRFLQQPLLSPMSLVKRVGVFVNPSLEDVSLKVFEHSLDAIQLHGDETPEFCSEVVELRPVIKAFGVDDNFTFQKVEAYSEFADYFLFDNKTSQYGGSGKKFNWQKLLEYEGKTPFLLSGGITLKDINEIMDISHPGLDGIDVNSGFEISPGVKDLELVNEMMKIIRK